MAKRQVIVVRYADDLVLGFESRVEAQRFLQEFRERLAKFGLELHPEKTRLIEFGRFAARDRADRGLGKPETFTFLGFTHYCGKSQKGEFTVWRETASQRSLPGELSIIVIRPHAVARAWNTPRGSTSQYRRFVTGCAAVRQEMRHGLQKVALAWPTYGYRRVTAELRQRGFDVNRKRVLRLLREDNLLCLRRRSFVVTTDSRHDLPVYPNLARGITPSAITCGPRIARSAS